MKNNKGLKIISAKLMTFFCDDNKELLMRLSRDVLSLLKRDGTPSGIRAKLLNIHIIGSVE